MSEANRMHLCVAAVLMMIAMIILTISAKFKF